MRERLEYMDSAKAILIVFVILGHEIIYANPNWDNLLLTCGGNFIYAFHMPAFFILSGVLFHKAKWKDASLGAFISSRVYTLLLPYLVFEVIGILVNAVILGKYSVMDGFLYMVTFRFNVGADWFLPAMFIASLLMVLISKLDQRVIGWAIAILCLLSPMVLPESNWWNLLCRGLMGYGYVFIGYELRAYLNMQSEEAKKHAVLKTAGAFLIVTICAIVSLKWWPNDMYTCICENPLVFLIGGLTGTYMAISVGRLFQKGLIPWIGRNSLTVMGTHQLFLYAITAKSSITWIAMMFVIICISELLIIFVFERYLPFLVGKKKGK